MRNYLRDRRKEKRLKIAKRGLALLTAIALGYFGITLIKGSRAGNIQESNFDELVEVIPTEESTVEFFEEIVTPEPTVVPTAVPTPEATPVPTPEPVYTPTNGGDSVYATTDVNMRLSADKGSFKLGTLNAGSVVDRLATEGDWDLIRTGDTIAYVHTDYTRPYEVDYNNEYYDIEEYDDIVKTTTKLNFRLGPDTSEQKLFQLDKNEEVVVIGKAIRRDRPNEVWYLAKARGQIGFISAESKYTKSYRSAILAIDPSLTDVKIERVARVKRDTSLYDANHNYVTTIDEYQIVNIIESYSNYSLVEMEGKVGLISNNDISVIKGRIFVADISSQRVFYYYDGEIAFRGRCTTGKDSSPTELGYFPNKERQKDYHDFGHDGYVSKKLYWTIKGNQAFHDAPWEDDDDFGDTEFYHRHGSAGCVRLPDKEAQFVYDNVPEDTPRLVKK